MVNIVFFIYIVKLIDNSLLISFTFYLKGWIASILLLIGYIFSENYYITEQEINNSWFIAIVSTMSHTIWSMILIWIILASVSNHKGNFILFN